MYALILIVCELINYITDIGSVKMYFESFVIANRKQEVAYTKQLCNWLLHIIFVSYFMK